MVNLPAEKGRPGAQIVLIDTPGVHKPTSALNRKMMQEVHDALQGRDLILLIVDAAAEFGAGDRFVLDLVKRSGGRVFLLLNKIDAIAKPRLLPLIAEYSKLHEFAEIIPISALKRDGLEVLLDKVVRALPEGPRYFPKDQYTDQPERFLAAEIVREKVLVAAAEEVPYAATVQVENYEELPGLTRIHATIYCERDGQKKILVGKGGSMLKRIGTSARLELERILGTKVYLELFVKVSPEWRESKRFLEELDWRQDKAGG
jgi:GTP-binding protein Era